VQEDTHVAEITHLLSRAAEWPYGLQWIVRRARPSRRQINNLTAFEWATGWRYSIIVTNIPAVGGIGGLPGSHHAQFINVLCREHAIVEDQANKAMGLRDLSNVWVVNCGWVLAATSPPSCPPGADCSACTTATTSGMPNRTHCAADMVAARPAGPPRPRPRAEGQPDLALEGRLPGLLAVAVRPAGTRLISRPVLMTPKGARPGAVGAGARPKHIEQHRRGQKLRTRHRGRKPPQQDQ
jgi:hypothetical protein